MKNKLLASLILCSYLFAGSYENGIEYYKKAQYKKAMDSFLIATNNNDNKAMLVLGIMYSNGDGVSRDLNKSFEWFEKSANAGNFHAYSKLGNIYASKRDFKTTAPAPSPNKTETSLPLVVKSIPVD